MINTEFDIIIIGAGIIGSATAYYLSKTRERVLLLEQFTLMHKFGSSHGQERIIRKTYPEAHFTRLMRHAFPLWKLFEKETNDMYYLQTGGLDIGPDNSSNLRKIIEVAKSESVLFEYLTAEQINNRFPAFKLAENYYGIFQKDSGIILASKALSTFQQFARNSGVRIHDKEEVLKTADYKLIEL